MASKKYQIFISSTYRDLIKERELALSAVLSLSHMPVGMELFPSTDNDQLRYIRGVIDNCDYYLLLVGGRYGSVDDAGISFTEREFDYAAEKGLHIIAFVRNDIEKLPPDHREVDQQRIDRLTAFRSKVQNGRVAQPWRDDLHLQGLIYPSLINAFNEHPRRGWVREDESALAQYAYEIKTLAQKCEGLEAELLCLRGNIAALGGENVAGLDHGFKFHGTFKNKGYANQYPWSCTATFGDALSVIGPFLMQARWDSSVNEYLASRLIVRVKKGDSREEVRIDDDVFGTFQSQLQSLGLISVFPSDKKPCGTGLAWSLTEGGKASVLSLRAVKVSAK
jgi:hypothetical protein